MRPAWRAGLRCEGASECSRTGSARDIDGLSYGYTYRLSGTDRVVIVNTADYAVLFIPEPLPTSLASRMRAALRFRK